VNLATGLYVLDHTDAYLPDVIPIVFTRTYRQNDGRSRALGMSTTHSYDAFLVGDTFPYTYIDLIQPDGGRIHYNRISPGTGVVDAVYETASAPTRFYKSQIVYNTATLAWDMTLKDGTVYTFPDSFNADRPQKAALTRIRDRFGNTLTIARDANGSLTRITSPNGRLLDFTSEAVPGTSPQQYRLKTVTDHIGRQVVYTYDTANRLAQVQDVGGGVTTYTYAGTTDRLQTVRTARQNEECPLPGCTDPPFLANVYYTGGGSADGLVQSQTLGDGSRYLFSYTFDGSGKITQTDVTGPRFTLPSRRVTLNSAGYVVTDTRGLNTTEARTETYARDGGNLVTSVVEPLTDTQSRTTTYSYNADGDLLAETRLAGTPDALNTQFTREAQFHQIVTMTDPLGHVTTFDYDPHVVLSHLTDPTNRRTQFAFAPSGQVTAVTQPVFISDPNPVFHTTGFTYSQGDLVGTTDPLGNTTTRFVDGAGRLTAVRDPLGRVTRYQYDARDHVTQVIDPLGGITTLTYDQHGNLKTVEDARQHTTNHQVTSYSYDVRDRLVNRIAASGSGETFAYDEDDHLKTHVDRRGRVADFQYDGRGRLRCVGYGRQSGAPADCATSSNYEHTIGYVYDAADRVLQLIDSITGTLTRTYDGIDRLMTETPTLGPSVTYAFTKHRRQTMTVAAQPAICYGYDDADRLVSLQQGGCGAATVATLVYDEAGRRAVLTLPNGVTETYGYTTQSLLESIHYAKADLTSLGEITYAYDPGARRTTVGGSRALTALPGAVTEAAYDDANALLEWTTDLGTTTLTHDANGNVETDGTSTYTWDAANRLVGISGGIMASFVYDPMGRRLSKVAGGTTTAFVYDGLTPVAELDGSGLVTAGLLTGLALDEFLSRTAEGEQRTFLADGIGSTIALTDATGALQTQYRYEPFGQTSLVVGSPNDSNPYHFTGREDDDTGVYYHRARYYSPTWGRFISEDPLEFDGGDANLYRYVRNDPVDATDRLGLYTFCGAGVGDLCGGGGGGGGGADAGAAVGAGAAAVGAIIAGQCASPLSKRCAKVRDRCIRDCSESSLPSGDYGFRFFKCVNACMRAAGC
jgi:RHS repeat-associated protein